jgi:tetratricopeptide (TPR) repeat protein
MKAEHRKELMTNTLAQTLEHTVQRFKEGPSKNTVLVVVLVVLGVVLFLVWHWFAENAREADSARWVQWDSMVAPVQLENFLKEKNVEGTEQALLTGYLEARRRLYDGVQDLGFNSKTATDDLIKARDLYEKLSKESSKQPVLEQEALLGAGRACESLGDYDRARGFYDNLVKKYPDSARGQTAQKRLAQLNDPAKAADLKDLANAYRPPLPAPDQR